MKDFIQNDSFNSDFVYVYIIQLNRINNPQNWVFIKTKQNEIFNLNLTEDGYYMIYKIIVPRDISKPCYYYSGKFYKGNDQIEIADLVELNTSFYELETAQYYYFQVDNSRECYKNYAKSIIDKKASIRCDSLEVNKEDIYKRDLVRSTLNVINYLVEDCEYDEAERLLERIMGCNGLCFQTNKKCSCGCGK